VRLGFDLEARLEDLRERSQDSDCFLKNKSAKIMMKIKIIGKKQKFARIRLMSGEDGSAA